MIDWFPQEYAEQFFYLKGAIALIGTITLIWHMNRSWEKFTSRGQQLRYITLLYFAVLLTAASVEQVEQGADVNLRNIGAIVGVALLVYTMVVTIREDRAE